MTTSMTISTASSVPGYPVRFVLPTRCAEISKEIYEAERLAEELKGFPHRLNLSKAPSDIRRGGHSRWVVVTGNEQIKIAGDALKLNERLNRLLNSWASLSEKKTTWIESWTHDRELKRAESEIRGVSDRVSMLNQGLFELIPEGKVWQLFCICCKIIPGKSFDNTTEYAEHRQTCKSIIERSDEVAEKERETFALLRKLQVGPEEIKRVEELIKDARESAIRAVNVLKDPGVKK